MFYWQTEDHFRITQDNVFSCATGETFVLHLRNKIVIGQGGVPGHGTWKLTDSVSYYNDDPHNIRNRPENGGGAVMDIGCYNINVSRMLFDDEPTSISATVRRDPTMGIDTLTSAVLEFPGGGQATFTCSIRAEDDQRVHIVGTSGRIDVEIPFNSPPDRQTRIFVTKGGDPPVDPAIETHVFAAANQYTIQAHLFAQAILDDTAAPVPISDAIANMRVIETVLDP